MLGALAGRSTGIAEHGNGGVQTILPTRKMGGGNLANLTPLFAGAGRLLAGNQGARVAVLDVSGWDTHVNEGAAEWRALARRLAAAGMPPSTPCEPRWVPAWGKNRHCHGHGVWSHRSPQRQMAAPITARGGASFLLGGAVAGGAVRGRMDGA